MYLKKKLLNSEEMVTIRWELRSVLLNPKYIQGFDDADLWEHDPGYEDFAVPLYVGNFDDSAINIWLGDEGRDEGGVCGYADGWRWESVWDSEFYMGLANVFGR